MNSRRTLFLQRLDEGPLLCDGAMGTELYGKGFSFEQSCEALNLSHPDVVRQLHDDYVRAGVDILQTNTFGANRVKLEKYGLADQVCSVNHAAVELARNAACTSKRDVLIAGGVGPIGRYIAPIGQLRPRRAFELFHEQITALVDAGVDLLLFETFSDLKALEQAVAAARAVDPDIPVVAQVTFVKDVRTPLGDLPARVAEVLDALDVDVIGANCSVGPALVLQAIRALTRHLPRKRHIIAQPNAGWPQSMGNRLLYPASSAYFAEYAIEFLRAGVSIVGGCCGTTPDHIAKMRSVLDSPQVAGIHDEGSVVAVQDETYDDALRSPTSLAQRLAKGEFVISVEMHPPRGASVAKVIAAAESLQEAGANAVNVADSPVAQMRMSPWAICHLIQNQLGLEAILNFPVRGRNLLRIQGDLLAAHALDIRNIFVVMGDPTTIGDYPDAFDTHDIVSTGLIRLITHEFNNGVDHAGRPITEPTNFLTGCALNLNPVDMGRELKLLKKKIDCGADFAITQPLFAPELLDRFLNAYAERYEPLALPVVVSIMPLHNYRNAVFLHNEVPGIAIPEALRERMRTSSDRRQEGKRIAIELAAEIREKVQGIYVMPQFQQYHTAAAVVETLR